MTLKFALNSASNEQANEFGLTGRETGGILLFFARFYLRLLI